MDASIDFSGVLRGSIADGGGGGGGDTVVITPVVTSGTKIADVSVNGVEKNLYCPTPQTPPEIDITPVVTSGTKIADVSIGGIEKDLYAPDYGADITALDGRLDTAEGNISEIKQSLSQLDGMIIYKDLTPTDDYAEFNDGSNLPLISLISTIEPIQSGSGTPSPDNPRSISGHTDMDIIVSPNSDFSDGTTYSVNFVDGGNPLTVYGGTLDVVSGVLTVDSYGITITGTESFIYKNSNIASIYGLYVDSFPERPYFRGDSATVMYRGVCSMFKKASYLPSDQMQDHTIDSYGGGFGNIGLTGSWIRFKESSFADYTIDQAKAKLAEFYANGQPLQIVFPMNAKTYQLTPTQVKSLLGQNYISSDVGDITNVKYLGIFKS